VAATFLGRMFNRRMTGHRFSRSFHIGLVVVGTTLLIRALFQ
jgi:hypothetical protein